MNHKNLNYDMEASQDVGLQPNKKEYLSYINDLLKHEKVQEMKKYNHHSQTDCFEHSIHVSYYNYLVCKKLGLDARAAARAGLLHDMFLYDWHTYKPAKGERLHGFEHPKKALANATKYFDLSSKEKDIIEKHMFPLTFALPKYKETGVIICTDKFCSSCEVLDRFFDKNTRRRIRVYKAKKHFNFGGRIK